MSQRYCFQRGAQSLRVVVGDDGAPSFVAADVLAALTLDRKALERLDDDERGTRTVGTPGGCQEMTTVSESGVYSLMIGSRKPEAKQFKRWITGEVLPALRKPKDCSNSPTRPEELTPTQDRIAAILLLGKAIAQMPGSRQGATMVATLACIQENTGLSVEALRNALSASLLEKAA